MTHPSRGEGGEPESSSALGIRRVDAQESPALAATEAARSHHSESTTSTDAATPELAEELEVTTHPPPGGAAQSRPLDPEPSIGTSPSEDPGTAESFFLLAGGQLVAFLIPTIESVVDELRAELAHAREALQTLHLENRRLQADHKLAQFRVRTALVNRLNTLKDQNRELVRVNDTLGRESIDLASRIDDLEQSNTKLERESHQHRQEIRDLKSRNLALWEQGFQQVTKRSQASIESEFEQLTLAMRMEARSLATSELSWFQVLRLASEALLPPQTSGDVLAVLSNNLRERAQIELSPSQKDLWEDLSRRLQALLAEAARLPAPVRVWWPRQGESLSDEDCMLVDDDDGNDSPSTIEVDQVVLPGLRAHPHAGPEERLKKPQVIHQK